jgi:hypothetical protein
MNDKIYYCTQENNDCPKKEECKRYLDAENKNNATLFKASCTENNNYVLFIKAEINNEKEADT